jgi:hypothetical protein
VTTAQPSGCSGEGQAGPGGYGILAEEIEVELNTIIHDSGQFANNQIDFSNPAGLGLSGLFQSQGQHTLGNAVFMHTFTGDTLVTE